MDMPFGRHRGMPVETVPIDYLLWLVGNIRLKGGLKREVRARLEGKPRVVPIWVRPTPIPGAGPPPWE